VEFTLDLSWSSLYDNLDELLLLVPRICNVHVQGRISCEGGSLQLKPRAGELNIERAIAELQSEGYTSQWTLELVRAQTIDDFRQALRYLYSRVYRRRKRADT
jgi:sugar phosphate isomerase/epimerase